MTNEELAILILNTPPPSAFEIYWCQLGSAASLLGVILCVWARTRLIKDYMSNDRVTHALRELQMLLDKQHREKTTCGSCNQRMTPILEYNEWVCTACPGAEVLQAHITEGDKAELLPRPVPTIPPKPWWFSTVKWLSKW